MKLKHTYVITTRYTQLNQISICVDENKGDRMSDEDT
jgi:hypothetical protein